MLLGLLALQGEYSYFKIIIDGFFRSHILHCLRHCVRYMATMEPTKKISKYFYRLVAAMRSLIQWNLSRLKTIDRGQLLRWCF